MEYKSIKVLDKQYMEWDGTKTYNELIKRDYDVRLAIIEDSAKFDKSITEIEQYLTDYFTPVEHRTDINLSYEAQAYKFIEWYLSNGHHLYLLGYKGLDKYRFLPYEAQLLVDKFMSK